MTGSAKGIDVTKAAGLYNARFDQYGRDIKTVTVLTGPVHRTLAAAASRARDILQLWRKYLQDKGSARWEPPQDYGHHRRAR